MNNNISGINLIDISYSLQRLEKRTRSFYSQFEAPLAIIIGVISGIACVVFSVYIAVAIAPRTPLSTGGYTIPGGYLAATFGGLFLGTPFLGISLGILTLRLMERFTQYKTNCIAKVNLRLHEKYENTGLPDVSDLQELLKIADHAMHVELIKKMSVEQLLIARDCLGKKKFDAMIGTFEDERFRILSTVFSLNQNDKPENLVAVLKKPHITAIAKKHPLITKLIYDQLKDIKDSTIQNLIKKFYCPPQWSEKKHAQDATAIIKGKTYQFNLGQLKKYSGTLRDMLTDSPGELKKEDLEQHFQDYTEETIDLFFDLINEKHVTFDKQKLLNFIGLCDRLDFDKSIIAYYLQAHASEFSEDELMHIVETLPGLEVATDILDKQLMQKKHTDASWFSDWERGHVLGNQTYKKSCFDYAENRLITLVKLKTSPLEEAAQWLGICKQILDDRLINSEATYDSFCTSLANTFQLDNENLRRVYEFSDRFCIQSLKESCLNYCRTYHQHLKQKLPWNFSEIPDDIAKILYPEQNPA